MTKLLNTILILVPVALFAIVGWTYLDTDGSTTLTWEAGENSPFVHGLRPSGRVSGPEKQDRGVAMRLSGDPVYLSVTPPGNYEYVDAKVWLDGMDQPMVEFGATVNAEAGQIDLRPLIHQTIDGLDWDMDRRGDLALYARNGGANLDAVLDDPPPLDQIATYHYSLPEDDFVPRAWTTGRDVRQSNVSLRGFHEFVTATDGRGLSVDVMYMDMNRNPGADPVAIRVYQDGELVAEAKAEDDGVDTATNASLDRRTLRVDAIGLQPGLLKVELNGNNDIYWREVNSSLPRLTYSRNVFVGDEVGYLENSRAVELWTDAQHLTLFTRHAEAVQTVTLGSQEIEIAIPHEHYHVENQNVGVTKLTVPKGDVLVVTDGRVAFSRDAFFNPFPVQLDDRTNLDKLGVDYVIARYQEPVRDGSWDVASVRFWLPPLEREGENPNDLQEGSYRFVFSLPNSAERMSTVDIHKIELTFTRPPRSVGDILSRIGSKLGL